MDIIEKIINLLEWSSKKDLKNYSEKEMQGFAEKAFVCAIGIIFIPILIIMPFQYAKKAKQSSNAKVVKKAKKAEYIALLYLSCFVGGIIYLSITDWRAEKMISSNSQIEITIDFKNLSSDETVNEINQLSPNAQIVAYKKHSELIEKVGQVWLQNLQGDNFEIAMNKTLPVLLSQGWTEESARDALSWMTAKSFIILGRNPEEWCKGPDCKKQSDEEIKITLREDKILSEDIINGIFQELKIDSNVY